MWENVMPGVWQTVVNKQPSKEPFEPAKCDPYDFEARLKKIREYGSEKVGQHE